MFSIGDIRINNRVVAAPLAGVTDKAFRMVIKSFGCGLVYTEMVSDMGLVYGQAKTEELANVEGEEKPIAIQIFGSEVEPMVKAAAKTEQMGADIIDINMGCPTPKIVKNGEGAALMLNLPRARQIIRAVVETVKVPVTIKMRKGWDDENICYLDLAEIARQEGVKAVTLHGRTRAQYYSGKADWDSIKELKRYLDIPVIGNGDIWSADDALRMIDYTGCDAVMIARGAMGNPFIFREAVELVENNRRIPPADIDERINTALKHLELACRFKGEAVAIREMRKHFAWYTKGMRGAARIREEINQTATKDEMVAIIKEIRPRITGTDV